MRPRLSILLLPVIIILFALQAKGQGCDGSLGDPVINEDFSSGPNPGLPLAANITNMTYTSDNCPNDGSYTIANSISGCFGGTWFNVAKDHTGNPNGYMMVVNASYSPSIFYIQGAKNDLCPNTTYQFAAWVLNLDLPSACGGATIQPNITFTIKSNGVVLQTYNTGNIAPSDTVKWIQYGTYFTTQANISNVTVEMTNNAPGGCGNDIVLDDITFRACGPIIQTGFGSVTGTASQPLCQGDNAEFTLKAQVANNDPAYQWQTYHTTGWVDTAGQNTNALNVKFTNAYPGVYQYRLGVENGSSTSPSCRVYSQPLTVNVYANPVIQNLSPPQSKCVGDTLTLSASGGVTYQWSGPGLPATTQNPVTINNITSANAGTYKVIAYNQYSCETTGSTTVAVYPKVIAAVTGGGTTICAGDSTKILSASGGMFYSWSPGNSLSDSTSANPIAFPADTTTYTVKVINANGCFDTKTATINVLKKAVAKAGSNKVIFEGQSVKLTASEKYGNLFYWTPTAGLNDPTLLDPVASPTDDITYTLHVTSTNNCGIDSSSVYVKVYKKITIPNTFSPNNDGINDYWDIDALITYPDCLLMVFDRYGQQVYRSIGYNKPWDGKYNGQFLPVGTYYYVLDLKNNTPKIAGWVLIVR